MKVKLGVIGLLFCLSLFIGMYFTFYKAKEYLYVGGLTQYLPITISILSIVVVLKCTALLKESFTSRDWHRALLVWGILFISLPICYPLIEPNYTFNRAQIMIHEKEGVQIIEKPADQSRLVSTEKGHQLYRIYAVKNGEPVQFAFDPYTGHYSQLHV